MLDVLNFMSDLEAQLSKMCTAVDHSWMRIRIETSCDIVVVFFKLKFEVNLELEVGADFATRVGLLFRNSSNVINPFKSFPA